MKNKESILKKEIDIANLSVSIFPTIALIIIFAFAFSVSVLGEWYADKGFDLVEIIVKKQVTDDSLSLSYLDIDFVVTLIGGFFIAFRNFLFLLNKNHARAVLLQPKKRSAIFTGKVFLPLTALVMIVVVIKIIALSLNLKYASLEAGFIAPFIEDVLISLKTLFWGYMCGVAGAVFTSRKVEAVLYSISLALLPFSVISIVNYSAAAFLRGYTLDDFSILEKLTFLDPLKEFYSYVTVGYYTAPFEVSADRFLHPVIWIILSVSGLVLIKRYFEKNFKFENCGIANKNKLVTIINSFSLPVVLGATIAEVSYITFNPYANVINVSVKYRTMSVFENLTPSEQFILLTVFVGSAVILSVVFNIICTVRIANLKEKAKPLVAIVGSTALISLFCFMGGLGYENRLPEVEDIEKIRIEAPYDLYENTYELIGIADYYDVSTPVLRYFIEFNNVEDFKSILDIHSVVIDDKKSETTESIKFTYLLKDGSEVIRSYRCIGKESAEEILKLWDTNGIKDIYKQLLFGKTIKDDETNGTAFLGEQITSMDKFVYLQSKDAVLTSLTDVLSENEIKELKAAIYKDVTSLAHYEWFKPTESYGLLQFTRDELTKESLPFVMSSHSVSFQVTREMTNTVEFLKAHDLMKFFKITREPVKAFLVDANKLGEYNKNFMQGVDVYGASMDYPMLHRMMFAAETSVTKNLYFKDSEPMFKIDEPWCKELTAEEYKEYMNKSNIKYFSGDRGTLLVVAYPESSCAYALMVAEN
ncbi:MAG: hypothetical protein IKK46_08295 [Clostridia bacterium]|nr:hypothetical protein [Clostridia bacterium]